MDPIIIKKLTQLLENEKTSVLTPVKGLKAQAITYVTIFLIAALFSWLKISTENIIFGILLVVLMLIPLIGIFGLYAAIYYIKSNGRTKLTTRGIIYNVLYIIGNGILYVFIYFISKYGVSV